MRLKTKFLKFLQLLLARKSGSRGIQAHTHVLRVCVLSAEDRAISDQAGLWSVAVEPLFYTPVVL
jgi:hypothetical protein